jgi:Domain of unknown function (DUF4396)
VARSSGGRVTFDLDHHHGGRRHAIMLMITGAMRAGLGHLRFWVSLAVALLIAGAAAFPVNRWLISRGLGHALVHEYHSHHLRR